MKAKRRPSGLRDLLQDRTFVLLLVLYGGEYAGRDSLDSLDVRRFVLKRGFTLGSPTSGSVWHRAAPPSRPIHPARSRWARPVDRRDWQHRRVVLAARDRHDAYALSVAGKPDEQVDILAGVCLELLCVCHPLPGHYRCWILGLEGGRGPRKSGAVSLSVICYMALACPAHLFETLCRLFAIVSPTSLRPSGLLRACCHLLN